MPVIRIDDEVWNWLKGIAEPLVDTPNSVLRRLAGLDQAKGNPNMPSEEVPQQKDEGNGGGVKRRPTSPIKTGFGRDLNKRFGVGANHALYRETGDWYEELREFPGALFDANGYILFRTADEYERMPGLRHGRKLSIKSGISSLPGYIKTTSTSR